MSLALKEAKKSLKTGDVPIGCIIVKGDEIIAKAHNEKEKKMMSTCHAELLAIEKASKKIGHWRLHECTMYVTLEPCPMCAGGIINSRIKEVYIGARDDRCGALGGKLNLVDFNLGTKPKLIYGIMEKECSDIISTFFAELRKTKESRTPLATL